MNTLEAIANRKSTRSFRAEQISEETLEIILKAGCAAPVAMARYDSLHITVVQKDEIIAEIFDEASDMITKTIGHNMDMNYGAKTLVVVSSTPIHRSGTDCVNVGIVVENMVLAATDIGVDSCIMGAPIASLAQNTDLSNKIGIPEGFTPIIGVVFGYATEKESPKQHTISINRV